VLVGVAAALIVLAVGGDRHSPAAGFVSQIDRLCGKSASSVSAVRTVSPTASTFTVATANASLPTRPAGLFSGCAPLLLLVLPTTVNRSRYFS